MSLNTRKLQLQHTTEGYRDGITAGKAENIQAGFDEGFNLGANIGLRAGRILGLLEGVVVAIKEGGLHNPVRTGKLLCKARMELSTNSLFSEEYWSSDGSWKYTVTGSSDETRVLFEDVAREHPLIKKWDVHVNQEVKRWNLYQNPLAFYDKASQTEVEEITAAVQLTTRQLGDW